MTYVRRLVSERREGERVIRVYEVETPGWYAERLLEIAFPKLVTLELRLSRDCERYFRKVPYSLAETIWAQGLRSWCCQPFCCCYDFEVLYYPIPPEPRLLTRLSTPFHDGPIVLEVGLCPAGQTSMLITDGPPISDSPETGSEPE